MKGERRVVPQHNETSHRKRDDVELMLQTDVVQVQQGEPEKTTCFDKSFFHRYKFLAEFVIYLRCDILLRNAICCLRQREKGIYIISQPNEMRLYRIYKVNISHERERVYR